MCDELSRCATHLQDEEPVMVQVDPATLEKRLHFLVITLPSVDRVLAAVVLVRRPCDDEARSFDDFKFIGSRLYNTA